MENASKALLIAGAILLVIALIAIGMAILGQGQNAIDTATGQVGGMGISTHNSMFDEFEQGETVSGRAVKNMVTKLITYNQEAETDFRVTFNVVGTGAGSVTVAGANTVALAGIGNNLQYNVTNVTYNADGIISAVTVTSVP